MSRFGAGLSEHPLPTHAIGEVIGQVDERVGARPDLAVLFVDTSLSGVLDDFVATVHAALVPRILVGATTGAVIGGRRLAESAPAVSLWAAQDLNARPVRIEATPTPDGIGFGGFDPETLRNDGTLVMMSDPFSFPVEGFLRGAAARYPDLSIVGGVSWGARGPGGNRFVYGDAIIPDGAVGFWCDSSTGISARLAQCTRPIGVPLTVTGSAGSHIIELASRPAAEQLQSLLDTVDHNDRARLEAGLHIGIVPNERVGEFREGDFIVRSVVAVDDSTGAITVSEVVDVGSVVQFQIVDPQSARRQLATGLAGIDTQGALLFDSSERNESLFSVPNHDADAVADILGDPALAGMTCVGEVAPLGSRNYLHAYSAAIVAFGS